MKVTTHPVGQVYQYIFISWFYDILSKHILQNTALLFAGYQEMSLHLYPSANCFIVETLFLYKLHCCFAFYAFELDEKEINSQ